jgi:hypothetical protein
MAATAACPHKQHHNESHRASSDGATAIQHHHHQHHHAHDKGSKTHRANLSNVTERPRQSPYAMVSMTDAVAAILAQAHSLPTAIIPIKAALGFVLDGDVVAQSPLPPFNSSMKDGYAVRPIDFFPFNCFETLLCFQVDSRDGPGEFDVVGPVTAGDSKQIACRPGAVVRITTGAPVPPGADAVVQV